MHSACLSPELHATLAMSQVLWEWAFQVAQWYRVPMPMQETGNMGLIPGSERSPGVGNPLQYSWLENSIDRGSWWATVRVVAKSET